MALGSCNYDVNGLFQGCNLGEWKRMRKRKRKRKRNSKRLVTPRVKGREEMRWDEKTIG